MNARRAIRSSCFQVFREVALATQPTGPHSLVPSLYLHVHMYVHAQYRAAPFHTLMLDFPTLFIYIYLNFTHWA